MGSLVAFAALIALVALFTRRIEAGPLTVPAICLAAGFGAAMLGLSLPAAVDAGLSVIAEAALAVLLFADAAGLRTATLGRESAWPVRMLLIGIPLATALGTLFAWTLLPLDWWEAALIAALLVPTDAALGETIFTARGIPERTRHALVVESGVNDGMSLPLIIFLACGAVGFEHRVIEGTWFEYAALQIGGGIVAGIVLGAMGGLVVSGAFQRGWTDRETGGIGALAWIGVLFGATTWIGGNGFVGVFVGGLVFGRFAGRPALDVREFMDAEGALLSMTAFLFIGVGFLPVALAGADWRVLLLVGASMLIVRPVAIWLSLLGSTADARTRLILGWFGPRGLATALFALIVVEEFEGMASGSLLITVAGVAVALSALVHGATAHRMAR